jgi:hypothetical protein
MPVLAQQPTGSYALGADALAWTRPTKTLVSPTRRRATSGAAASGWDRDAGAVGLVTRMPIDEARMETYAPFHGAGAVHRQSRPRGDQRVASRSAESVVDIYAGFGRPVRQVSGTRTYPTLAGHRALAREFVDRLAA